MPEKSIKYLLGIDGGGTKTEFLLTDINTNEINRIILGTSNPVNIGIKESEAVLRKGITEICEGLDYSEISVFAGLAGSGSDKIKAEISCFLSEYGFGKYLNGTDADSALAVALKGKNGIAVLMGTGIIAFCCKNGETQRIGGRGYLIDKGTSGFCLGSAALNAAFECIDGRGGSEIILKLIEEKLGNKLDASISEIYAGGVTYIASFAPVLFEAYKKGDSEAERIIDYNAQETAKLINAANGFFNEKTKTVICGGLSKQKEILCPFLEKYMNNKSEIEFSEEPIVYGAIFKAKANIQGDEKYAEH